MSGGGREFVTDVLQEIEPDIIKCLRNAEFDKNNYRWMLLRQNNYKAVDIFNLELDKNR